MTYTMYWLVTTLYQLLYVCHGRGLALFNRDVVNQDALLTTIVGIPIKKCISECDARTSCQRMTYRRTASYCRLYGRGENRTVSRTGTLYSERSWWIQMPVVRCNLSCPETQHCRHQDMTQCGFSECSNPTPVHNADMAGNVNTIGAKVYYQCSEGYDNNGDSSTDVSTCMNNGTWTSITLVCVVDGFIRKHIGYQVTMSERAEDAFGSAIYTNITRTQCVSYCRNETRYCSNASYFPPNGTCILSDKHREETEAADWEVISKVFPVMRYKGSGGRYSLYFNQALELCITHGTTMATYDELDVAYSMGYHIRHCGWVTNGNAYAPLHYDDLLNNFSSPRIYVCSCETKYDVFCKNPNYNQK